jgi:hypothetical protein
MKKLILLPLFLMAALSTFAQTDAISRFFNKYQEDERFTVVYISPKLFQMISKIEVDDPDWKVAREVIADLGGLRVLTADSVEDGTAMYKEALSKVPVKEYEELLTVRDGDENVRFWIKETNNRVDELVLLVGAPTEFTLLSFTGRIDLNKIASLSKSLDVDGMKHLEKVGEKKEQPKTEKD